MEKNKNVTISQDSYRSLVKIVKKYSNLYKALHLVDQSLAAEFKKKQEQHFVHKHAKTDGCCNSKINTKIFIPKEQMNNIEKNLYEIVEKLYYPSSLDELLVYLNNKYEKIMNSGLSEGLTLDAESERDLLHRLMLEGIPFYISEKLKKKLVTYEESISEQPMLLAHPSNITNLTLVDFINSNYIKEIIENDFTVIQTKFYTDIAEYELYDQFKYLYLEGYFEDCSLKMEGIRSDFIFKYPYTYFKNTKHKVLHDFSHLMYFLPYELNMKNPSFGLQTNDYLQASFFRENFSFINDIIDSSFIEGKDTGKKLTALFVLFPYDLEISRRKLTIILTNQDPLYTNDNTKEKEQYKIEITSPLSCIIFKSRKLSYQIPSHSFPFILIFYYLHGPADRNKYSC